DRLGAAMAMEVVSRDVGVATFGVMRGDGEDFVSPRGMIAVGIQGGATFLSPGWPCCEPDLPGDRNVAPPWARQECSDLFRGIRKDGQRNAIERRGVRGRDPLPVHRSKGDFRCPEAVC